MKVLIFTNILTPYRIAFFDALNNCCKSEGGSLQVLVMSSTEENRNWNYDQYKRPYTKLLKGKRIKIGGYYVNVNVGIGSVVKRMHPDIVIAAGSYIHPSLWLLISICNACHIPVLFWSESHLQTERQLTKSKLITREAIRSIIYKKFIGFCYAGELSKQFINKYAKPDAKYIFLPNLIDDAYFGASSRNVTDCSSHREENTNRGRKYIIPARLSPDKGILEFLEIFKDIDNKYPVEIIIAGDGELEEDIKTYSDVHSLNVKLIGFVNKEHMRELYQNVDGFILPSRVDPNPLTCIEALWSGLPMLVSDHVGNYPEVILHGQNGYVFSYTNNKAKNVMTTFFNNDDIWYAKAAKCSKEIAERKYSMTLQTKRFYAELEELIKTINS